MAGTTGTLRRADFSSSSASVAGTTCATSTPNGARTSSLRMWKSRDPDARAAEVEHGDDLAGLHAAEHRRRSAEPHVDAVGRVADDLQRFGDVAELERHAEAALDDVLAGDRQPEQRRERDRQDLQAELTEGVVAHQPR